MSDTVFKVAMTGIFALFLAGMVVIVRDDQQQQRDFVAGCALRFRAATTVQDSTRILDRHPGCAAAMRPTTPSEDRQP